MQPKCMWYITPCLSNYANNTCVQSRLETLICRFSVVVRRLATTDELIKTAGVAGYTQSVLVPELAVLMVKDDMKVNDEEARRIMRESMDIGARVHPDLNIVPIPEDVEES